MNVEAYVKSLAIPGDAPSFDGAFFESEVSGYRTLSVNMQWDLNSDVSTYDSSKDWSVFKSKRYNSKSFTVNFAITCNSAENLNNSIRKLKALLHNCSEKTKIIFNGDPEIYYEGLPVNVSFTKIVDNSNVTGSFEVQLFDGLGYSINAKEVSVSGVSPEGNSVDAAYNGTEKNYPVIEATIKENTGFFSCRCGDDKIITVGDTNLTSAPTDLINYDFSRWGEGGYQPDTWDSYIKETSKWYVPEDLIGTDEPRRMYSTSGDFEKREHGIGSAGGPGIGGYYGPIALHKFTSPVTNIQAEITYLFNVDEIIDHQTGGLEVFLIGTNPESETEYEIARFSLYKSEFEADMGKLRLWVNKKVIESKTFKMSDMTYISKDPVTSYISKEGDTITFNINGKIFSYTGLFGGLVPVVTRFAFMLHQSTNNRLPNLEVRKVVVFKDAYKSLRTGDKVEIDVKNAKIYKNGIVSYGLGSIYNDFENFYLKPGNNSFMFQYSKFVAQGPDFKIKYREAYL